MAEAIPYCLIQLRGDWRCVVLELFHWYKGTVFRREATTTRESRASETEYVSGLTKRSHAHKTLPTGDYDREM